MGLGAGIMVAWVFEIGVCGLWMGFWILWIMDSFVFVFCGIGTLWVLDIGLRRFWDSVDFDSVDFGFRELWILCFSDLAFR